MSAGKFRTPKRRVLGTLKLPDKDAKEFLEALNAYGQEKTPAFLRQCAYALIAHHKKKDPLNMPLLFQLGHRSSE